MTFSFQSLMAERTAFDTSPHPARRLSILPASPCSLPPCIFLSKPDLCIARTAASGDSFPNATLFCTRSKRTASIHSSSSDGLAVKSFSKLLSIPDNPSEPIDDENPSMVLLLLESSPFFPRLLAFIRSCARFRSIACTARAAAGATPRAIKLLLRIPFTKIVFKTCRRPSPLAARFAVKLNCPLDPLDMSVNDPKAETLLRIEAFDFSSTTDPVLSFCKALSWSKTSIHSSVPGKSIKSCTSLAFTFSAL
mmetsp:Transcript_31021/g.35653  ORF Transcript_31021/g.35653 Transcript_31021/m.35653 type:complete len:251 (+) Transcript_31021:1221-1973(+)